MKKTHIYHQSIIIIYIWNMKHETKRRNVKDTRRLTDFHRFIKSAVLTIRMNISSYRLEICYTPEKCYHGYAGPPSLVLQYVPEANQIWQSGSSPSTLVNQPISKGRKSVRVLSGGGKNRRKEKRDPHESKIRYPSYFSFRYTPFVFTSNEYECIASHCWSAFFWDHFIDGMEDINIWKMQIFHIKICRFLKIHQIFWYLCRNNFFIYYVLIKIFL